MRIYPIPGLVVRDPVKRDAVPESGRDVPDDDIYWQRRLADGDVVLTAPKAAEAEQADQPSPSLELLTEPGDELQAEDPDTQAEGDEQ